MKKHRLVWLGALCFATCLFAKAIADYDHSIDFGKYQTYAWIGVTVQEPLWQDRVKNAIDAQLTAKGWRRVETRADASIAAFGSTHEQRTLETWYSGSFGGGWFHRGWAWGAGPGFGTTTTESTPVGTLHIDIFDSQSKRVIWHGVCTGTLSGNPEKNVKKLNKAIADVFKKFPPPTKG